MHLKVQLLPTRCVVHWSVSVQPITQTCGKKPAGFSRSLAELPKGRAWCSDLSEAA